MSGKSTATEGAKRCTVPVHEGFGRVDVWGWYPARKQQAYGRGKQGGRSHGRADLLVEEREVGRESNEFPATTQCGHRLGRKRVRRHGRTALQV